MLLGRASEGADITLIEGVMGYYDGLGGVSSRASSCEIAKITRTPVILIVDAKGAGLSLVPLIRGFADFRDENTGRENRICGVILNRVSGMLYPRLKRMIEEQVPGLRVLGYVPEMAGLRLQSRHLGLVMPGEIPDLQDSLEDLAEELERSTDIDEIIRLAQSAPPLFVKTGKPSDAASGRLSVEESGRRDYAGAGGTRLLRIALARDEAFCFVYEENLQLLRELGAQIVPFSPLRDSQLPSGIDGLLLFGGYPELHARALSENESMRADVKRAVSSGLPVMAECGGFMYLQESMEDMDGQAFPMAGALPGRAFRTEHLVRFGYAELTPPPQAGAGLQEICDAGAVRVHEFHYYDTTDNGDFYAAQKPAGGGSWRCMQVTQTLCAGFPHLYYPSNPKIAQEFLRRCRTYRTGKEQDAY